MSHAALPPLPSDDAHPSACENCGTPLQGDFCHACGQSTHSPVRNVAHAVEEVFESFWHLDGRIFRTLRDLFVPGRIANRYLGGHRVRYVAPMRLFVILTLLTFFVAKFVVQDAMQDVQPGQMVRTDDVATEFAQARTVDEVRTMRDDALAGIAETRRTVGALPGVSPQLDIAAAEVRAHADTRIAALAPEGTALTGMDAVSADSAAAGDTQAAATPASDDVDMPMSGPPTIGGPIGERIERNIERFNNDPQIFVRALFGVAPTALFILVPLFAVLLKLLYLFRGRLYLEHVVVGLYSHAALMLALLLVLCGALASPWLATHAAWSTGILGFAQILLLWAMPVYLLLMQKRVYGQSWPWTLVKFAIIGMAYFALFLSVAIPMAGYALYAL
ncbi:DUF3667 domain-containing protein [Luteimonas fraxinea]|uniref:DUF3667 domain-containing protein n=1 Tax=Luteimonas fraxinea TaxID=2901869 RepID=A0ABS8UJ85_9GAMM|nr:DUF3667 domain-containing protein [Luteimonas fraxinea]MCD9098560.1 DUF3667 domain-containing protein [Luteimonas fraxinea]MCD9127293.1 DUF3667 domain-containing protein [Luteimonas fraxinea]